MTQTQNWNVEMEAKYLMLRDDPYTYIASLRSKREKSPMEKIKAFLKRIFRSPK